MTLGRQENHHVYEAGKEYQGQLSEVLIMICILDMNALTEGDSFSDIIKMTRDTIGLNSTTNARICFAIKPEQ